MQRLRGKLLPRLLLAAIIAAAAGLPFVRARPWAIAGQPAASAHTWRPLALWYGDDVDRHVWDAIPACLQQSELRFLDGDDPIYALPQYDDAAWSTVDRLTALPRGRGIFWIRLHVRTTGAGCSIPTGVFFGSPAACEFFWDGRLIREFGHPGASRASEVAGPLYTLFDLPTDAATEPGDHVVALRMSTYRLNRPEKTMSLMLLDVQSSTLVEGTQRDMLLPLLGVGAMCVIALAAGVFWILLDRRLGLALFAALALGGAVTVFLFNVREMFPVPYSWSYPLWATTELIVAFTVGCLVALVGVQFGLPYRRWVIAGVAVLDSAAAAHRIHQGSSLVPHQFMIDCWRIGLPCALGLALWACARRQAGARVVLAGIAVSAVSFYSDPAGFLWRTYPIAMLPTLLGFVVAIGVAVRDERREAREAKLTAARLELELLRKSLQPHFLMNTLTALAQAIEENPPRAVRLIDDLAAELRTLAHFAQERHVPLARELELCRTHLRVMSVRTERRWELEADGVDPDAVVPPALFFTLIENGFTHQQPIGGANTFRLRAEPVDTGGVRYRFFSPGHVRSAEARSSGGSGLRYVKARLEETWTGAWGFDHRAAEGGWETVIELRRRRFRRQPA